MSKYSRDLIQKEKLLDPYSNGGKGNKRWWERWYFDLLAIALFLSALYLIVSFIVNSD